MTGSTERSRVEGSNDDAAPGPGRLAPKPSHVRHPEKGRVHTENHITHKVNGKTLIGPSSCLIVLNVSEKKKVLALKLEWKSLNFSGDITSRCGETTGQLAALSLKHQWNGTSSRRSSCRRG